MPPRVRRQSRAQTIQNIIDLWKAIHGGCWPGPPPDRALTQAVNEVMTGLAVHNLANGFQDRATRQAFQKLAAGSLQKSLPQLQRQLG